MTRANEMDVDEALTWLDRPELAAVYGLYIETYKIFAVQKEQAQLEGTRSKEDKRRLHGSREGEVAQGT